MRGVAGTAAGVDRIDRAEQALDLRLVIGAQVVAGAVRNAQGDEAVAGLVAAVVLGVVAQGEGGAGGAGAHRASGLHLLAQGVQGLHLAQREALALGRVFVGVGAGDVGQAEFGQRGRACRWVGGLALRAQAQGSVVGAGEFEAGGVHGGGVAPAGQAVFGQYGA